MIKKGEQQSKEHPFSEDLLQQIRIILGGKPEEQPSPGQPFYLDLIHGLARELKDPDMAFPLTLKEGVPLGVDEPTLRSPGIWPTKIELTGTPQEDLTIPTPTGKENYQSAIVHEDIIEQTFMEEKQIGLVEGHLRYRKQQNAASARSGNCVQAPLEQ